MNKRRETMNKKEKDLKAMDELIEQIPCLATHDEICDMAQEHYYILSGKCSSWLSTIPKAIEFYRSNYKHDLKSGQTREDE